jgi:predicted  nucleic acid-binding Zn-ribbon protein
VEDITSLEDLLDLQSVDSEIDRLLDRRGSLVELEAYRGAHRLLTRLDGEIAAAEGTLRELDLAEDRAEGEMNLDEEKLVREERRLYAGNLSARDATNLRDEVEMLRKRVSTREDEALGLIEQREQGQDTVDRLHKERTSTLAEIVPRCDPELVRLYEEIRPSKEGVAVTTLVDGVCGGCHLRLSAAEESQALRAFPPRCHHCRRILAPR